MSHDVLSSGTHLGQYEVIRLLGAGGMGQVWLARDSTLDRDVAIKLLPQRFQADQQARMRFEREAKLLATLNHPHIAQIYGSEELDGQRFLVLELVEGQTLSQRIKQGPMPIDETLDVCRQIAEGLETAHAKGIIHRDLKPGNVMLRDDGFVKVLDFGLACATDVQDTRATADSPTMTRRQPPDPSITIPGMILGTAGYMSPEQARGRPVDKRSDIWSFGIILHECLSGQKLFDGESVSDSLGAILHKEIDWRGLPTATPVALKRLLRRLVVRDPKKRLHDIADARIELQEIEEQLRSGSLESAQPPPQAARRGKLWPVLYGLLAIAFAVSFLWPLVFSPGPDAIAEPRRSVVAIEQITDLSGVQFHPNVSADGKMLLYVSRNGGDLDIFKQPFYGGANATNLTEKFDVDDSDPAFSPDGNEIAFRSEREGGGIYVMGVTGELPRRISDDGFDPAWSPDGKQIVYTTANVTNPYSRLETAELWIVDVESRQRNLLFRGDAVGPQWSPNDQIAFWSNNQGQRDIWTIPATGGEPVAITQDVATDWNPLWAEDGKSLYFISDRNGTADLWRVELDLNSGAAGMRLESITNSFSNVMEASLSANGGRCAIMVQNNRSEILNYSFDQAEGRTTGEPQRHQGRFNQFHTSPDGKSLAYVSPPPREDIWIAQSDGTSKLRLIDDVFRDRGPRWSPDGRWLTFYSNQTGNYQIWLMRKDGTGRQRLTNDSGGMLLYPCWSPDGKQIAFTTIGNNLSTRFLALKEPLSDINEPILPEELSIDNFSGSAWSPDGSYIIGTQFKDGAKIMAVYDFENGEISKLLAPDGKEHMHISSWNSRGGWIDERQVIIVDSRLQGVYLCNIETGESRLILQLDGVIQVDITDAGQTLIVTQSLVESEIWMLDLGASEETTAQ